MKTAQVLVIALICSTIYSINIFKPVILAQGLKEDEARTWQSMNPVNNEVTKANAQASLSAAFPKELRAGLGLWEVMVEKGDKTGYTNFKHWYPKIDAYKRFFYGRQRANSEEMCRDIDSNHDEVVTKAEWTLWCGGEGMTTKQSDKAWAGIWKTAKSVPLPEFEGDFLNQFLNGDKSWKKVQHRKGQAENRHQFLSAAGSDGLLNKQEFVKAMTKIAHMSPEDTERYWKMASHGESTVNEPDFAKRQKKIIIVSDFEGYEVGSQVFKQNAKGKDGRLTQAEGISGLEKIGINKANATAVWNKVYGKGTASADVYQFVRGWPRVEQEAGQFMKKPPTKMFKRNI